ncbi:MAG: hypothetical protein ACI4DY_04030 [Monoglobaceae bacterium]
MFFRLKTFFILSRGIYVFHSLQSQLIPLVELVVLIVTSLSELTGRTAIGTVATIIISDKTSAGSFWAVLVLLFVIEKSSFLSGVP